MTVTALAAVAVATMLVLVAGCASIVPKAAMALVVLVARGSSCVMQATETTLLARVAAQYGGGSSNSGN